MIPQAKFPLIGRDRMEPGRPPFTQRQEFGTAARRQVRWSDKDGGGGAVIWYAEFFRFRGRISPAQR
jgi:hypothetical protein